MPKFQQTILRTCPLWPHLYVSFSYVNTDTKWLIIRNLLITTWIKLLNVHDPEEAKWFWTERGVSPGHQSSKVAMWTLSPCFPFLTFLISSSFHRGAAAPAAAESALSGWTACSSRMLLVLGQRLGFFYTPTTPFHQAGIPATINQSGDSPWMSVNMFPSLPLFPTTFLPHSLCRALVLFSLFFGV